MHKVTQIAEYGIHVILHIANRNHHGHKIVTAQEISDSQNISLNYTQQILMKLRQGGLVESIRGPKGGFYLKKSPHEITLRMILELTEGETAEIICEKNPIKQEFCSLEANCYLKSVWFGLKDVINEYLEKVTIEDLLNNLINKNHVPLINMPSSH